MDKHIPRDSLITETKKKLKKKRIEFDGENK